MRSESGKGRKERRSEGMREEGRKKGLRGEGRSKGMKEGLREGRKE